MGQSHRTAKVADRIKEVVASQLESRVKDPRLGFVTVTDVQVTGDLQHASIFYTVLGDDAARENTAAALKSATGIIRAAVGRELGTRVTPTITFHEDALPETARAIDSLIEKMHESDAALEELRKGAHYAGDEDPYKAAKASDED